MRYAVIRRVSPTGYKPQVAYAPTEPTDGQARSSNGQGAPVAGTRDRFLSRLSRLSAMQRSRRTTACGIFRSNFSRKFPCSEPGPLNYASHFERMQVRGEGRDAPCSVSMAGLPRTHSTRMSMRKPPKHRGLLVYSHLLCGSGLNFGLGSLGRSLTGWSVVSS
jgi:hypothetical protein